MPSARELLEQADALMRRNRNTLADDIPVLTEAVPAVPEAQVLRGRGAQGRGAARAPSPLPEEGDTIPTLTERVESVPSPEVAAPAAVVAAAEEGDPSDWLQREAGEPSVTGEIPDSVLIVPPPEEASIPTEDYEFEDDPAPEAASRASRHEPPPPVAEEIELLPPLEPGAAEAAFDDEFSEASVSQAGTFGDEWVDDASTPYREPVTLSEGAPAVNEALEEFGEVALESVPAEATPEGEAGARIAEVLPLADAELAPLADAEQVVADPVPHGEWFAEVAPGDAPVETVAVVAEEAASWQAPSDAPVLVPDAPAVAPDDATATVPAGEVTASIAEPLSAVPEARTTVALAEVPLPSVPFAQVSFGPAPAPAAPVVEPPPAVPEETRWEGVAEEIRMQVLQRIDIFTDTGLREQLALRLQPIVDRASADLVATINQHVGELLRAYVAEAIEREIEIWRRSH